MSVLVLYVETKILNGNKSELKRLSNGEQYRFIMQIDQVVRSNNVTPEWFILLAV